MPRSRINIPETRSLETIEVLSIVVKICILYMQTFAYIILVHTPTVQQVMTSWLPTVTASCAQCLDPHLPWQDPGHGENAVCQKQLRWRLTVFLGFWNILVESLFAIVPDILFFCLQSHCNTCKCWSLGIWRLLHTSFLQEKDWPLCRSAIAGC